MSRLSPRILLFSVIASLLGVAVLIVLVARITAELVSTRVGQYAAAVGRATGGLGCEKDPKTWALVLADGSRIDAFDMATLRSVNPDAPPLDEDIAQAFREGELYPFKARLLIRGGGLLAARVTESGPCSGVYIQWKADPTLRRQGFIALFGVLGFAVLLGFARLFMLEKNRALSAHLGDVAHDLRTPIASLQLALEELSKRELDATSKELTAAALSDAVYIEALTENLRFAAAIEEGLALFDNEARVDLSAVVDRVVMRHRILARQRGVGLESAVPDGKVIARCTQTLAERALGNLVHNAIRYVDAGGHVAIVLERAADKFRLIVVDDGPGVPPDELPRLAGRTYRSDAARARDQHGTGLGLSITTELCLRAGFTLSIAAENPRGLRATIEGPAFS